MPLPNRSAFVAPAPITRLPPRLRASPSPALARRRPRASLSPSLTAPSARLAAVMRPLFGSKNILFGRPDLPPTQRLQIAAKALGKAWVGLKVSRGDMFLSVVCLFFSGALLRGMYSVYRFILGRLDPEGRLVYRPEYKKSIFRTLEREHLLQIGGALHLATIALKILCACGKGIFGISDPVKALGGTPLRFERLSTVVFWAYTLAKIKERLLLRGDIGAFKSGRQRFVLNRVMDVLISVLVFLACCETIGLPLSSLAAAGGVGGLVVGLASKEIIENLFGGIALLFTSPFIPGDVIVTPAFQGRVAAVGPYTTQIENFDGGKALVPNALITRQIVTNLSRASRRRFSSRYSLRYADMKAVPEIVKGVKEGMLAHPLTVQPPSGFVRSSLTSFGSYSLELQAECLVRTNSKDLFLDYQQTILLLIANVIEENDAEFETEFPPELNGMRNELK